MNFVSKKLAVALLLLSLSTAVVAGCDSGSSSSATATPVSNTNAPAPQGTVPGAVASQQPQAPRGVSTTAAGVPTPDMSATEVTTVTLTVQPQQ